MSGFTDDQVFGSSPAQPKLLSDDEVFGTTPASQPQAPQSRGFSDADVFGKPVSQQPAYVPPITGEVWDNFLPYTAIGRVLDAFGQGAAEGWGSGPLGLSDTDTKELRRIGVFNDYANNRTSIIKSFNEAFMRPAAAGLALIPRGLGAIVHGLGAAAEQAGRETGTQTGRQIGETAAGFLDYLGQRGDLAAGIPELNAARELGVIGKGQEGWLGEETPLPPAAEKAPPRAVAEAASAVPSPAAETAPPATIEEPSALIAEESAPASPEPDAVEREPATTSAESPSVMAADMEPEDTLYGPAPSPDLAGNIRLDLLNTPEDVSDVIRQTAAENADFLDQRRGVVSDADVLNLADALGMDAAQLNTRQIGQAFNAEQITAARQLLIDSATAVRDAMAKAADGSDEDVLAYAEAKARHQMIQGQVAGITAEAGRALRAFQALNTEDADSLGDFLASTGGKTIDDLREEARLGSTLDTAEKVSKFVNDTKDPTARDIVQYVYLNGLISGPVTHLTYSAGNFLQALWHAVPEKLAASGLGAVRAMSDAGAERVYPGEVGASLYGMLKGTRDGIPAAIQAFKNNVAMPLPGEEPMLPRLVPIKGKLGTAIGIPGRGVAAIHSLFRSIAYEQRVQELAYRNAARQGLSGNAFAGAIADFVKAPPVDAMRESVDFANAQVYMKRPDFGSAMWHAEKFVDSHLPTKILVPFMRIGQNIIEQAYVERSPVGLLSSDVRGRLAGKVGEIAADEQRAKLMVGVMLGAAIIGYAAEGLITGEGPSDPNERRLWLVNHQPYSARIGSVWVPYRRLGALGMLIGGYANLYEAGHAYGSDGLEKSIISLIHGTATNVLDETWMSGLSDFMRAIERPEEAKGYAGRLLAGFIPYSSALRQTATFIDPYARQTNTVPEMIQNTIPFASERLMPKRDVWGNPVPRAQDLFSAIGSAAAGVSRIDQSPVTLQLQRLGIAPALLRPEVRGVQLEGKQADDFLRYAGRFAYMRLQSMIDSPGWQSVPDWLKRQIIIAEINHSHEAARTLMMMQHPEIIRQAMQNKTAKLGMPAAGAGAVQ